MSDVNKGGDDCYICMEPMTGDTARPINCDHNMCFPCMRKLIHESHRLEGGMITCPYCRSEFCVFRHRRGEEVDFWEKIDNYRLVGGSEFLAKRLNRVRTQSDLQIILADRFDLNEPLHVSIGYKKTPLSILAAYCGPDMIELMIRCGAHVNTTQASEGLETPLFSASRFGNTDVVRLLLDHGALQSGTAKNNLTAFVAARHGNIDALQLLMEHPSFDDVCDGSPVFGAIAGQNIEVLDCVLSIISPFTDRVNVKSFDFSLNILYYSIYSRDEAVAIRLFEHMKKADAVTTALADDAHWPPGKTRLEVILDAKMYKLFDLVAAELDPLQLSEQASRAVVESVKDNKIAPARALAPYADAASIRECLSFMSEAGRETYGDEWLAPFLQAAIKNSKDDTLRSVLAPRPPVASEDEPAPKKKKRSETTDD